MADEIDPIFGVDPITPEATENPWETIELPSFEEFKKGLNNIYNYRLQSQLKDVPEVEKVPDLMDGDYVEFNTTLKIRSGIIYEIKDDKEIFVTSLFSPYTRIMILKDEVNLVWRDMKIIFSRSSSVGKLSVSGKV